jgi:hypothetical protein
MAPIFKSTSSWRSGSPSACRRAWPRPLPEASRIATTNGRTAAGDWARIARGSTLGARRPGRLV